MKQQIFLAATFQVVAVAVYLRPSQSLPTLCQADLPVAKDLAEQEAWRQTIDQATPSVKKGYFSDPDVIKRAEELGKDEDGCKEDTYGELSSRGALALFSLVNLTANDTFADLGSGLGKLAIQAAVFGGAGHVFGVELSKKRHELACKGLKAVDTALQSKVGSVHRRKVQVQLIRGSMLEKNLSKASVVWMNAVCFRAPLFTRLGQKLGHELSENTRIAMTTYDGEVPKSLPSRLHLKEQGSLHMSWSPAYPVNVLQASGPPT